MPQPTPVHLWHPALCPTCGYDVRAAASGRESGRIRCPECGAEHEMEDLIRPEVPARPRWPIILLTIAPGSTTAVLGWLIGYRGDLACCVLLVLAPILTIVHAVATYRIAAPRSRSDRRFTRAQAALLSVAAMILDLVAIAVFFHIFAANFQGV